MPPVLCYHRVGGPLELGVTRVGRTVFERQMRALAMAGGRALSLAEFEQSAIRNPRSAMLLTFDDGYASLADTAYPVLADLGFTATTFLITDYIGRENTWDVRNTWHRLSHLDWDTIARWQARGFEFGSHTATHRRLTWLPEDAVAEELGRSRNELVQHLGPGAGRAIAYPFGALDARITRMAAAAGYTTGFGGVRRGVGDALALPRVPVYMWDRGSLPFGVRDDTGGSVGQFVVDLANRCAVGTSVLQALNPRHAHPHRVVPLVDVDRRPGDTGRERAAEKGAHRPDFAR